MLNRNLLESEEAEQGDGQLQSLALELTQAIKKAKTLGKSCKVRRYEESEFKTDSSGELIVPTYEEQINYNEEFWKKYLKNQVNFAIIKQLSQKVSELQRQVKEVEAISLEYQKLYKIKNRKKNRRLANEIEKSFDCPYDNCYRVYGSQVSLNLHIKLKHGGGNKSDRERLAEDICLAELKGLPHPQLKLNLPKGFLDEYRSKYQQKEEAEKDWSSAKKQQIMKLHLSEVH